MVLGLLIFRRTNRQEDKVMKTENSIRNFENDINFSLF